MWFYVITYAFLPTFLMVKAVVYIEESGPNSKNQNGSLLKVLDFGIHDRRTWCLLSSSLPLLDYLANTQPPCSLTMQFPWRGESCTGSSYPVEDEVRPNIAGPPLFKGLIAAIWLLCTPMGQREKVMVRCVR